MVERKLYLLPIQKILNLLNWHIISCALLIAKIKYMWKMSTMRMIESYLNGMEMVLFTIRILLIIVAKKY